MPKKPPKAVTDFVTAAEAIETDYDDDDDDED